MKVFLSLSLMVFCLANCTESTKPNYLVTDDISRFWNAYDSIVATSDTAQQYAYLQRLYLDPGSPGLKAFRERREYTPEVYLQSIRSYPKFWASVRANTLRADEFAAAIEANIFRLKALYPELKPAKLYFTIGALMSGGTTMDSLVLIGAEIAMADSNVVSEEFPDWMGENLRRYFDSNPIEDLVLLNVHEYVHTQQNAYGYDLLSQSLFEGVAEFVSVTATEKASTTPAIEYGKQHEAQVKSRFAKEMFSPHWNDWLYNNFTNEFKTRDLGYYIGYALSEAYYEAAPDKRQAIKTLIELDYQDQKQIEAFVDGIGYFDQPLAELKADYEAHRPEVLEISSFQNHAQNVDPGLREIKVTFSHPMSQRFRNQRIGPLGMDHLLPVRGIEFAADGMSMSYQVELAPNRRYQLQLTDQFRTEEGRALKPYLIDFKTKGK